MNAAITTGGFNQAANILRAKVPFPGVISHICDHPCEDVCRRSAVDEALSIRDLERAAMRHSSTPKVDFKALSSSGKQVAIVGAGLSGLTAALELARKGHRSVVFEASDKAGGALWDYPDADLPRDVLQRDLALLDMIPVDFRYHFVLGAESALAPLEDDFDAVYLGVGVGTGSPLPGEIDVDAQGRIVIDPVTFRTNREKVFAGGCAVSGAHRRSPIRSISDGRRAAISIDRYLQKVSLSASRDNEGPYETRLYTRVEGIKPVNRVPLTDRVSGYSPEQAVEEATRCLQCECMECVKVCEFLAHFKAYPRKYVRQIYNNLSIVAGQRHGNLLINSCSLCGLCKEVCPENLHMGEVCQAARQTMVGQERMPPSAHEFALRDMDFSNSDHFRLARHQPGAVSSAYLFFPGCQLSASSPEMVKKTYAHLRERLEGGVGIMLHCCGAPADWSGRGDLFSETFADFRAQWHELGRPKLILGCSTCHAIFSKRLPLERLVSLWEMIDRVGLPAGERPAHSTTVSVHDPCTSRHEPQIHESVRSILRKLGVEIQELPLSRDRTECCSFGGLMHFANPDLADKVARRRIAETSEHLLAYCAMCRDLFAAQGKPTWHLLDLIFRETGGHAAAAKGPDYSQRRENRARLKISLLRELWNEVSVEKEERRRLRLYIPEDVRDLLDKRRILIEDLEQVIEWAEKSGARLVHRSTGHLLAHHPVATVTYWVEYSPREESYEIYNAYSHRMEILEETKQ